MVGIVETMNYGCEMDNGFVMPSELSPEQRLMLKDYGRKLLDKRLAEDEERARITHLALVTHERDELKEKLARCSDNWLAERTGLFRSNARLRKENDTLRGLIAKSNLPCVYCSLPASDMAKCSSGFPGCGRADDLMMIDTDSDLVAPAALTEPINIDL